MEILFPLMITSVESRGTGIGCWESSSGELRDEPRTRRVINIEELFRFIFKRR
jgi:hypothetical protein